MTDDPESRPIFVLGTGSFAAEIADVAGEVPGFRVVGFVENREPSRCREPFDGRPVHWHEDLAELSATHLFVCGLGTTHRSEFTKQADRAGCRFATVVHPTARVSRTTRLGEGALLLPGAVVGSHSEIGRHVCINKNATVGHHARIGDFSTIGPGVNLSGNTRVGEAVFLGVGATVIDQVQIGDRSVVGAGAVVTSDVPERCLVIGVPARVVKRDIEGK